jgi:hypothetical protein
MNEFRLNLFIGICFPLFLISFSWTKQGLREWKSYDLDLEFGKMIE